MKFGVREICDVVLKAKANQKVGDKIFYKNEPVIYFDTLKTSSMEGAATTVYAQGGRGNSRLIAWDGERTVTFTMEDALISPAGFSILSGAGLINGTEDAPLIVHQTEQLEAGADGVITLSNKPYVPDTTNDYIYVMVLDENGEVSTEPYIYVPAESENESGMKIVIKEDGYENNTEIPAQGSIVLVDYYTEKAGSGTYQVDITPDKFGGTYYLEAATLFRDQATGQDMPAEFIIPNCKIQSNFTFTMASSGDPSTFTFTMDAFPDYTRFNRTKKVLAAIQIISDSGEDSLTRIATKSTDVENTDGIIVDASTLEPKRASTSGT